MKKVKVTNDDVFDFVITYHDDLERNPEQIDLTWMLLDYTQYLLTHNNESIFEGLFYIIINQ